MIRVHVSESLMALGTSVHVVDNFENGAGHVILRLDGNATRWEPFDPNDVTEAPEPTFRLPLDDGGRLHVYSAGLNPAMTTDSLHGLRAGLRQRMLSSPLLDGAQYADDVVKAFRRMWLTWCGS